MRRQLVIGQLKDTARLMELAGENFYKIRAYNNAAMALLKLDADFEELVKENRLREIPGVGAGGIEQAILEILTNGTTEVYAQLAEKKYPAGWWNYLPFPAWAQKESAAFTTLWKLQAWASWNMPAKKIACWCWRASGLKAKPIS